VISGPVARAAALAALGHGHDLDADETVAARRALDDDPDPEVRAAALGALVRAGSDDAAIAGWLLAARDDAPAVRRRAADLAPALGIDTESGHGEPVVTALVAMLDDRDVTVVEAACWALGELGQATAGAGAVATLARVAVEHRDALAREAAVAALGALGDAAGLPAILAACHDKVAIRRRAVLALAPFDGPEVDAALARALDDRDWQVRQAAEDLTHP
jgi:HEAT repeat protein